MSTHPYEDTALWLALESSLSQISASSTSTDLPLDVIKSKARRCFLESMSESLSKSSHPSHSALIRADVDQSGLFPAYRIENGRAQIYLKDAEVTLTSDYDNNQEVVQTDYVKLDVFPQSYKFDV